MYEDEGRAVVGRMQGAFPTGAPHSIARCPKQCHSCEKNERGVGCYKGVVANTKLAVSILMWAQRAPRRDDELKRAAAVAVKDMWQEITRALQPNGVLVQFVLGSSAFLTLPVYSHGLIDFRGLWSCGVGVGGRKGEIQLFSELWHSHRFEQNVQEPLDVCREFDKDLMPPWAFIRAVCVLAAPASKFVALHGVASLLMAQIGNMVHFALPSWAKRNTTDARVKHEAVHRMTPTNMTCALHVLKDQV